MCLDGQTPPVPATAPGWCSEVISNFAAVVMLGAGAWQQCCQNFPMLNDDDQCEGKKLCRFTNPPPLPPGGRRADEVLSPLHDADINVPPLG